MGDTASSTEKVKKIAQEIEELKGIDTLALDISKHSSWTNYFIITTVSSSAHLRGILKDLYDRLDEYNFAPLWRHKKIDNDRWLLIDCGDLVIHLMDKEAREFYDLEKLWFNGEVIFGSLENK